MLGTCTALALLWLQFTSLWGSIINDPNLERTNTHKPMKSLYELNKVSTARYPQAKCIDGTPGSYYLKPAIPLHNHSFLIVFDAGGWCWDFKDCEMRGHTMLGSSSDYIKRRDFKWGLTDVTYGSSVIADFNIIVVMYCDGGSFAGSIDRDLVTPTSNKTLHFRGKDIREAVIDDLLKTKGLAQAKEVVVGGRSAGALAVFMGLDAVAAQIKQVVPGASIVGLMDSGIFPDQASPLNEAISLYDAQGRREAVGRDLHLDYGTSMRSIAHWMKLEAGSNAACLASPTATTKPCHFAEHVAKFIETPFFVLQSQYDSWAIRHIYGALDAVGVNRFGQNMTRITRAVVLDRSGIQDVTARGAFLHSCSMHTASRGAWEGAIRDAQGRSPARAFSEWYVAVVRGKWMDASKTQRQHPQQQQQLRHLMTAQSHSLKAIDSAAVSFLSPHLRSYPCNICCNMETKGGEGPM